MTWVGWVYVIGATLTALGVGGWMEMRRQQSSDPKEFAATALPVRDGVAAGVFWPLVAAVCVAYLLGRAVVRAVAYLIVAVVGRLDA